MRRSKTDTVKDSLGKLKAILAAKEPRSSRQKMTSNHSYEGDSSAIFAIFIPKDFTFYLS